MSATEESVPNEESSDKLFDGPEDLTTQTVIQNRRGGGKSQADANKKVDFTNYEESMKQLASFQTIEHFWHIYNHMIRPSDIRSTTDYHLFKEGVKPTWEDPQNKNGGKWMVRLKKGLASLMWEEIVIAVIGEQFDVGHEICGAVCSVRNGEDIISIWNKTHDNEEATNRIRDHMRRVMKLPSYVQIEYKKHMDSLADKSSFRNPTLVWKPKERENAHRDQRSGGYNRENRDREGGHGGYRDNRDSHREARDKEGGRENRDGDRDNRRDFSREGGVGNRDYNRDREGGHRDRDNKDSGKGEDSTGGQNRNWKSTGGSSWSSNRERDGGGEGWGNRGKKREDISGAMGTGTAAGSAADWLSKKPISYGGIVKDKAPEAGDGVWSRRGPAVPSGGGPPASSPNTK